jgi:hypothetical protein
VVLQPPWRRDQQVSALLREAAALAVDVGAANDHL